MTVGFSKHNENGDYYDLIPQVIAELSSVRLISVEKK